MIIRPLLLVALFMLTGFVQERRLTVYLIGDSTIAEKTKGTRPETGWGTPFADFFDSTVVVDNRAKNGRSTKTFINENLWKPIVERLNPGDFVLIQFGHNDEAKEKVGRYTTPDEYRQNLIKFVNETRAAEANPVLLTPVTRRKFVDGKIVETHAEYSPLVREAANKLNVPLIDLDAMSRELLQQFGEDGSKLLFLHLDANEHPNYPDGKVDNTHFNELGARKMAQLVLSEILRQKILLGERVAKPKKK